MSGSVARVTLLPRGAEAFWVRSAPPRRWELKSLTDRLLEIERPAAKERQRAAGGGMGRAGGDERSLNGPDRPITTVPTNAKDLAAKAAGWSRSQYERLELVEIAAADLGSTSCKVAVLASSTRSIETV